MATGHGGKNVRAGDLRFSGSFHGFYVARRCTNSTVVCRVADAHTLPPMNIIPIRQGNQMSRDDLRKTDHKRSTEGIMSEFGKKVASRTYIH